MNRALPTRLLAAYDGLLTRHRLATTTVSGALLGGAGDVVVQHAAASSDVDRTAAFFIFGGVLTGPINYRWLDFLAAASRSIAPQGGAASLAAKVALQSTVMQPLIYLPSFYLTNALVRRWSVAEAAEHVRAEYADTLRRLWLFWTPSVCFAFGVLPLRLQAVFFAGVGFAWNVVLSAYNGAGPQRVASVSQEQVRGV